jgi:hypothetical protein
MHTPQIIADSRQVLSNARALIELVRKKRLKGR